MIRLSYGVLSVRKISYLFCIGLIVLFSGTCLASSLSRLPLSLKEDDVIPTGNEWISFPDIRAVDGALSSFNVLSMRERGLLQVTGKQGASVLQPYFQVDGKPEPFRNPTWELLEYWIPSAQLSSNGLEMKITYCAPPGSRAAFVRLTMVNHRDSPVRASLGMKASWGALSRVTYLPVPLRGDRTVALAPWVDSAEVFSFITDDTHFAWSLMHPESQGRMTAPPFSPAPEVDAARTVTLAPGTSAETVFVLGVGVEEFSAPHSAKALRERLDRSGADDVIEDAAAWLQHRARTTGQADIDLLMNRNFFFTAFYAWGKTIDTEQTVGITSRSPRYYVSAAYWDRDAMLWSFPALLDIDPTLAREALEYALGTQLRNTGTHSRFIDGIVLEDGFQLDEAVAPLVALAAYVKKTDDKVFLLAHREALIFLRDRLLTRYDAATGLYSSLQDSQDEYQKKPFLIYDNVLAWRALSDLASLLGRLGETESAIAAVSRAKDLHDAILKNGVFADPSGSGEKMFAFATDGKQPLFADVPPGSLMKLPALGFVPESDPIFQHTYGWLHSPSYKYSYSDRAYGLPGSYRLPFTTSWEVADHLQLKQGRHLALKILRASNWDGGIITEGVDPATGVMDHDGRAFATAAGYVAHAICEVACIDKQSRQGK